MPQPQTIILSIEIEPNVIPDGDIGSVLAALANFSVVLDQIGDIMSQTQRASFGDQGSTFNNPWAALKASTLAEKRRLGYPDTPLVRTGKLQSAVGATMVTTDNTVTTGIDLSAVPYAIYHQTGTKNMPARVLVAVTEDEQEEVEDALMAYFADRIGSDMTGITITAHLSEG